jgi:hypothetical protein
VIVNLSWSLIGAHKKTDWSNGCSLLVILPAIGINQNWYDDSSSSQTRPGLLMAALMDMP